MNSGPLSQDEVVWFLTPVTEHFPSMRQVTGEGTDFALIHGLRGRLNVVSGLYRRFVTQRKKQRYCELRQTLFYRRWHPWRHTDIDGSLSFEHDTGASRR